MRLLLCGIFTLCVACSIAEFCSLTGFVLSLYFSLEYINAGDIKMNISEDGSTALMWLGAKIQRVTQIITFR